MTYGGGIALTVVASLAFVMVMVLAIADYHAAQVNTLRDATRVIDSLFVQRDALYAQSVDRAEHAWRKALPLPGDDDMLARRFVEDGRRAVIRADAEASPWLVTDEGALSRQPARLERYLRFIEKLSVDTGHSPAWQAGTTTYFRDAGQSFVAFSGAGLDEASLRRAAAHFTLAAFQAAVPGAPAEAPGTAVAPPTQPSYKRSNPSPIRTTFGPDPVSGHLAIISAYEAYDRGVPFGTFAVFDPIDRFTAPLRELGDIALTVATPSGEVVLSTEKAMGAVVPVPAFRPGRHGDDVAHRWHGGRMYLARPVRGTDWIAMSTYGAMDVWTSIRDVAYAATLLTVLMVWGAWMLLLRLDRRLFAPAFAQASKVYQSEQLNRAIVSGSPSGICVIDATDGRPLMHNDVIEGYAASAAEGPASFYRQLLQGHADSRRMAPERPDVREFELLVAGEGEHPVRHLLAATASMDYDGHPVLLCILRDLTARVESEQALEQARQAAESANRAKTSFVATMSHEIRTPLNGILGHLELLAKTPLRADQQQRLERIRHSADALQVVINDVLDFSKIEAGQLSIDDRSFRTYDLLEQVTLLYAPAAQAKGIELRYVIAADVATFYQGALTQIEQVLRNLLNNAIKFTATGRVLIRVSRRLLDDDRHWVRFEVIDSGIGMTPAQQRTVFEPFAQADASIGRRFGGTGLGLALCRQLSALLGGSMSVRSTEGVGSAFAFDVPLRLSKDESAALAHPLQDERIALLSPAAEWREGMERRFAMWGAETMVAAHPQQLDPAWVASADALVVFGDARGSWSESEETRLGARRLIRARPDGPLFPERRNGTFYVSCYSTDALLRALRWSEGRAWSDDSADPVPGGG